MTKNIQKVDKIFLKQQNNLKNIEHCTEKRTDVVL